MPPEPSTPKVPQLPATTTRLAGRGAGAGTDAVDLLAAAGSDGFLWHHEEFGLAGRGAALRIELPGGLADSAAVAGASGTLAAIARGDDLAGPGTGGVAFGAPPVGREVPGTLRVPRAVGWRREGEAWITTITGPHDAASTAGLAERMAADALGG